MTRAIVAAVALTTAGIGLTMSALRGDALVDVKVSPTLAYAPATVRLTVRLQPHENDRSLRIEAESGLFFRSSEIQLDGTDEPAVHRILLKSLPAGKYEVKVSLQRGRSIAATALTGIHVIGHASEDSDARGGSALRRRPQS